ncbi:MAG TPA: hypothetical protein VFA04_15795 [Bryobacteraceae bacterium]|nr:hypothetical protein [Bryobacteraceae bacterium]
MSIGFWLLSLLSFLLEVFVVIAIVRGHHVRRFGLVLALCIWYALGTVGSIAIIQTYGYDTPAYGFLYWTQDIVSHGLIVFMLLSLTGDAARTAGQKSGFVLGLAGAVLLFVLGSVALLYKPGSHEWMTPLTRNISFSEAILTFFLWTALVRGRTRDNLLLTVSAGIGLQVTGAVIATTFQMYSSRSLVWLPDLLTYGAGVLALVIWGYAFWVNPATSAVRPES